MKNLFHGTFCALSSFRPLSHFGTVIAASERLKIKQRLHRISGVGKVYPVSLDVNNSARFIDNKDEMSVEDIVYSLIHDFQIIPNDDALTNQFSSAAIQLSVHRNECTLRDIFSELADDEDFVLEKDGLSLEGLEYAASLLSQKRFIEYMQSRGFDSLVYSNRVEGNDDSCISFSSNQVTIVGEPHLLNI